MQPEMMHFVLIDSHNKAFETVQQWIDQLTISTEIQCYQSIEQLTNVIGTKPMDVILIYMEEQNDESISICEKLHHKMSFYHFPMYVITQNDCSNSFLQVVKKIGYLGAISISINQSHINLILESMIREHQSRTQFSDYFDQYISLVTEMPQGIALHEIICDELGKPVDYKFISVNESYEELTGLKASQIVGKTIKEILPDIEQSWIDIFGEVALTGKPCEYENYASPLNKYYKTVSYSPKKNQFVVIVDDITNRVNLTKKLHLDNQRMSRIMESAADIIFEFDHECRYVSVFGKGVQKMMQTSELFAGKTPLEVYGQEGVEKYNYYQQCLTGKTILYEWTHKDNNQTLYFESVISPIYDEDSHIIGGVGISRDITEQKIKVLEIEYLSTHDYLTGLYNRQYFVKKLNELNEPNSYPLGIMMIDVNGLKILNDAYGHYIGDIALKKIADTLKQFFRKQDIIARIGGDEFSIILPNTTDDDMENMKISIQKSIVNLTVENVPLSLAIGYESVINSQTTLEEVMRQAENYMYRNKLSASKSIRNNSIKAILKTLTDKYTEEKVHSTMVSMLCKNIGEALHIKSDDLKELELAGLFHDIGKISIPDRILDKPGKLTNEEYNIIKTHTENGYQILKAADEYFDLAIHALHHHERWDGNGYPKGLKGKEIPLFSRIISVADAYEAMTSNRSYRAKLSKDVAIEEIIRCSGTQFDPMIAKVFIEKVLGAKWI